MRRPLILVKLDSARPEIRRLTLRSNHSATSYDANPRKKEAEKFGRSVTQAIYKDKLVPIHEVIE